MRTLDCLLLCLALAATASPAGAEKLKLDNGDTISGELVEERDDAIVLEHPVLGRVEVPRERLYVEPPKPGLFGTRFMQGWTRQANLGVSGSQGNTVNTNITGGLEMRAANDKRRWSWTGRYFWRTEDGPTTDNNGRLSSRYDRLFPDSRWFVFLQPAYDFDAFKSWKHRITLSAGPGYDILKRESIDLRTSLGLSGQREFAGEKQTRLSATWGVETEWRIAENHTLTASNQIFPDIVNEPGEFRNLSIVNWRIRLSNSPGLNLNLGVENEYESDAPPEDKKNDLKYLGTLGLEF